MRACGQARFAFRALAQAQFPKQNVGTRRRMGLSHRRQLLVQRCDLRRGRERPGVRLAA